MTASIASEFLDLIDELEADGMFFGGPVFTGIRTTTPGSPSVAAITEVLGARHLVFVPAELNKFSTTFTEILAWDAPWLVFARLGVDVRFRDVYSDGTVAYRILNTPVTHYGFVLGPAQIDVLPDPPTTGDGWNL